MTPAEIKALADEWAERIAYDKARDFCADPLFVKTEAALRSFMDGGWRGMESAPHDGTVIIAMARYSDAAAGFPCFVSFMHGAWRECGRTVMEPMVCWAWKPRDVLGDWPSAPTPPAVEGEAGE